MVAVRVFRRGAVLLVSVLALGAALSTMVGCKGENRTAKAKVAKKASRAVARKPQTPPPAPEAKATPPRVSKTSGFDNPLLTSVRVGLLHRPSTCAEGTNSREVLDVRIVSRDKVTTAGGTYLKVGANAVLLEEGPCRGAGQNHWRTSATFVAGPDGWELADFGFEQEIVPQQSSRWAATLVEAPSLGREPPPARPVGLAARP
jgi:hypothetical protein